MHLRDALAELHFGLLHAADAVTRAVRLRHLPAVQVAIVGESAGKRR